MLKCKFLILKLFLPFLVPPKSRTELQKCPALKDYSETALDDVVECYLQQGKEEIKRIQQDINRLSWKQKMQAAQVGPAN